MNENYNYFHHRKTMRTFLYPQKAKNCETFLYTKYQTLFQKLDTWQKATQFVIRFYIYETALCVTRFFIEFLKFSEGGGHLFI